MRLEGLQGVEANGAYGAKMSLSQQGYDLPLRESGLALRSFMHLAQGEVAAEASTGKADIQGYGAGMALLWQGGNAYAQTAALAAWYEADMHHEGDTFPQRARVFLSRWMRVMPCRWAV